jgi:hypothetical protein
MMKRSLICFALVAIAALPASAGYTTKHWVYNRSNACAWITLDVANWARPWRNEASHMLPAGHDVMFEIDPTKELKIRAQPRRTTDCASGASGDDLHVIEKGGLDNLGNSQTTLRGHAGAFTIRWGGP